MYYSLSLIIFLIQSVLITTETPELTYGKIDKSRYLTKGASNYRYEL